MAIPRAPRYAGSRVRDFKGAAQITSHNNIPRLQKRMTAAAEVAAAAGARQVRKEAKAILRADIVRPEILDVTYALRNTRSQRVLIDTRTLLESIQARRERMGLWLTGVFDDQSHPDSKLSVGALGRIHEYGLSGTKHVSEAGLGPHYFFGQLGGGIPARHWLSTVADDEGSRARISAAMRNAYLTFLASGKGLGLGRVDVSEMLEDV